MALDFEVGQGATFPTVTATVDGTFTGSETVTFRLRRPGDTTWTTLNAQFVDFASGTVEYLWQAGDTSTAGYRFFEFVVTGAGYVASVAGMGLVRGIAYGSLLGIVGVEDIAAQKGRDLSVREVQFLEAQIPRVQAALEARLNRTIGVTAVTGERHVVDWSHMRDVLVPDQVAVEFVHLHRTPVYSVQRVNVDGHDLPASAYKQERSGVLLYEILTSASILPPSVVLFDYNGGLDSAANQWLGLPVARDAIIQLATRRLDRFVEDDAAGVSSLSIAGYSTSYLDSDFTEGELKAVSRYKKRVAW